MNDFGGEFSISSILQKLVFSPNKALETVAEYCLKFRFKFYNITQLGWWSGCLCIFYVEERDDASGREWSEYLGAERLHYLHKLFFDDPFFISPGGTND